jgi:hypothetical protein
VFDGIILSDLHLGGRNCQVKSLCAFLEWLADEKIATAKPVLNGDVFESIDSRRLYKLHWKVLSYLRKVSDRSTVRLSAGRTHHPTINSARPVQYNGGCWTELPCACLAVANGRLEVWRFPGDWLEEPTALTEAGAAEPAGLPIHGEEDQPTPFEADTACSRILR